MLDMDRLFNSRPFVYYVRDDYYAFGNGVCMKCNNESERHIILPNKYERYLNALNDKDISQSDAWEVYRKVNFVADNDKATDDHLHLKNQFMAFDFSDDEKDEIQRQFELFVNFFKANKLGEYYK